MSKFSPRFIEGGDPYEDMVQNAPSPVDDFTEDQERRVPEDDQETVSTDIPPEEFMDAVTRLMNEPTNLNLLHSYESTTYKFHLYLVPPSEFRRYEASIDRGETDFEFSRKYTLAESGVTTRYSIESVEIDNLLHQRSQVRGAQVRQFRIDIKEVFGLTFLDRWTTVVRRIGGGTITTCPMFLELSFNGFTPNGQPAMGISKFRWMLTIQDVKIQSDGTGGSFTHSMTLIPTRDVGITTQFFMNKELLSIEAGTMGEFIEELEEALNEDQVNIDGAFAPHLPEKNKFYKFEIDDDLAALSFMDDKETPVDGSEPGKRLFEFRPNRNISHMIQEAYLQVREQPRGVQSLDNQSINDDIEPRKIPYITPRIVHGEFVPKKNDFAKQVVYEIRLVPATGLILSSEKEDIKRTQESLYEIMRNQVKRKYFWQYTGKNIDVLNVNVDFNILWSVTLAENRVLASHAQSTRWSERRVQDPTAMDKQVIEVNRSFAEILEEFRSDEIELEDDTVEIGNLERRRQETIARDRASESGNRLNRLDEQIDPLRRLHNPTPEQRAQLQNLAERRAATAEEHQQNQEVVYALSVEERQIQADSRAATRQREFVADEEIDLLRDIDENSVTLPIRTSIDLTADTEPEAAQTHPDAQEARKKKTILEQAFARPVSMVEIELEIIGDPFWLGMTESERIQRRLTQQDGILVPPGFERANFDGRFGEYVFGLQYRIPRNINEDTGMIDFEDSAVISGLFNVREVRNVFQNGKFTQVLHAYRNMLFQREFSK